MGERGQLLCVGLGDKEFAQSIRAIREIGGLSASLANGAEADRPLPARTSLEPEVRYSRP